MHLCNCCALQKAAACMKGRPRVGSWLSWGWWGAGGQVGTPLGPLQVSHARAAGPSEKQDAEALAANASFINPSAAKGGRNCHNNSNDRLI